MTDTPANYPADLQPLAEVSARLGADTRLIQAAGGNTSIKSGDTLWVKASGLWLRDALKRPLFAPVSLSQVRQRVAAGEADPVGPALLGGHAPGGLRPSIETTLHALMPHAVVLHAHAVEAIAWAVLPDASGSLASALAAFRWAGVDYARPGLALTRAVAAVTARREVDVLLMANHGLVVGGASVAEAEARLTAVVAALRRPVRPAPLPDSAALAALAAAASATGPGPGWRLPAVARAHALATDALSLARAQAGVLYPDHVVFLGASLCTAPEGADGPALQAWLAAQQADGESPPCVALPGRGVLVRADLGDAAEEMLACWADVLQRLPASPEPAYLPADEVLALSNWEAEKFRQQLRR